MDIREEVQNGQHTANKVAGVIKREMEKGLLSSKTSFAAFREEFEAQFKVLVKENARR